MGTWPGEVSRAPVRRHRPRAVAALGGVRMRDNEGVTGHGHVPVLLGRVMSLLAPAFGASPSPVYVDGTLGMGGHAYAMLEAHPDLRLIGLDRDTTALDRSRARLAPFGDRVTLVHAIYDELPSVLGELGGDRVHGVLFAPRGSSPPLHQPDPAFPHSHAHPPSHQPAPRQRCSDLADVPPRSAPAVAPGAPPRAPAGLPVA